MRTCSRCGNEFHGDPRECVCAACLKPRHIPEYGDPLSPRDQQVSAAVADGLSNKVIAARLGLSEGTVKVYLSQVYVKLGLSNRTELALWYVRQQRKVRHRR